MPQSYQIHQTTSIKINFVVIYKFIISFIGVSKINLLLSEQIKLYYSINFIILLRITKIWLKLAEIKA